MDTIRSLERQIEGWTQILDRDNLHPAMRKAGLVELYELEAQHHQATLEEDAFEACSFCGVRGPFQNGEICCQRATMSPEQCDW